MNFDWLSLAHLEGGRSVSLPSARKKICWDIELMENIVWLDYKKQKNNQKTKKTISIWELSSFNHQTPSFQCWSFQIFQRSNVQVSHFQSSSFQAFELSTTKDRAFNPPTFSFLSFNHRDSGSQSSSIGLLIYKFLNLQVSSCELWRFRTFNN